MTSTDQHTDATPAAADDLGVRSLPILRRHPADSPMMPPAASTQAEDESRSRAVLVLLARRARRRDPAATVWTVVAYDPHTQVPIADIAQKWLPAGTPGAVGRVPEPVARWVRTVLGQDVTIGTPTDDLGHSTWHLHTPDGHTPSQRGGYGGPACPTHPASRPDAGSAEGTA